MIMKKSVTVHSPATVANVVCGFDVLGFAMMSPYDVLTLSMEPGERSIVIVNEDDYNLPVQPEKNVLGAALHALMQELNEDVRFEISSNKLIKPGSGIGSSAASAAGIVVAANELLGNIFSNEQLIRFAMEGEFVASGARHADNIAPCIYGGFTLVRSQLPLDIIPLSFPELYVVVLHPQIEVRTSDSRALIKKHVMLKDAITQWANVGGLVAGLLKGDYELIGRSLEDVIIEPVRSILIPAFYELKHAAMAAGSLGGGISGSGPSVFMFCRSELIARNVEEAMKRVYAQTNIVFHTHVSLVNPQGVKIVHSSIK